MSAEGSRLWDDIVPRVDPALCLRCADCAPVAACLSGSIRRNGPESAPVVDERLCFGCFSCAGACVHKAIVLPRSR